MKVEEIKQLWLHDYNHSSLGFGFKSDNPWNLSSAENEAMFIVKCI